MIFVQTVVLNERNWLLNIAHNVYLKNLKIQKSLCEGVRKYLYISIKQKLQQKANMWLNTWSTCYDLQLPDIHWTEIWATKPVFKCVCSSVYHCLFLGGPYLNFFCVPQSLSMWGVLHYLWDIRGAHISIIIQQQSFSDSTLLLLLN